MLFYQNLDKIIFNRNQLLNCDELVVISGYVGPNPIKQLQTLPIKSTVIYGMYGSDGIQRSLHAALTNADNELDNVKILYSTIPVHAKCYIWKYKGEVRSALVGSANFSTNGLTTPFKEVLADATADTFDPLDQYLKLILSKTIPCTDANVSENKSRRHKPNEDTSPAVYDKDVCSMPLFIMESGVPTVPAQSGINWGLAKLSGSHVNINDAYIRIGTDLIEHYPDMFPQKQECPSDDQDVKRRGHRHNDSIEILWDDGTTMTGLLEGSVPKNINGKRELYPKQISTTPSKAELGKYLRKRMGLKEGYRITYQDLQAYGRTTIDVSMQGEGIYYFDFSVNDASGNQIIIETQTKKKGNVYPAYSVPTSMVAENTMSYGIASTIKKQTSNKNSGIVKKGDFVRHKLFGRGKVKSVDSGIIIVEFAKETKKFKYPDALNNGYITLD